MLEKYPILITPFNLERTIRIYLPQSYYQADKSYPVLYMHDGQNVFQDEDAIGGISLGVKDYLDEISLDIIVVGIDSNTSRDERINEYCPWVNGEFSKKILGYASPTGGKGEAYLNFIVNELKPFIDKKYRTLQNRTYMAGISLGGLIATYVACRYPHIFTRIAAMSSAYYRNQEELENLLSNSDVSSIERFYLDCGTKEAREDEIISKEFVASNEAIYKILTRKIANTKFQIVNDGEHSYMFFRKRIPEVFSFLFAENSLLNLAGINE